MMDSDSRANLDRIVSLEPAALTEGDIAFLRARSEYLSDAEKERYAEVLEVKTPKAPKGKADNE